jgi:molybdopterin/thiamine biosynthesis adenylyltransferase
MMREELPPRYQRNYKTISIEDQAKLAASTVAIVGCGGLGGNMAEEFARLGIGTLILVDGDRIEESNLNRQLFATEKNIGQPKVEAAKEQTRKDSIAKIEEAAKAKQDSIAKAAEEAKASKGKKGAKKVK